MSHNESRVTDTLTPAPDAPLETAQAEPPTTKKPRRWRRRIGLVLMVLGLLALAYGACVYFWRDPVTDVYNRWKQSQLAGQLDKEFAQFQSSAGLPISEPDATTPADTTDLADPADPGDTGSEPVQPARAEVAAEMKRLAERFYRGLEPGQALGRIVIPELGVNAVFVNGTTTGDLTKGPGRYPETSIPGLGTLTAIAGHRTTFGAPFRNIDDLSPGDIVTLKLPYGTFTYRVFKHEIVDDEDWSIIRDRGFDTLVLSACHPLYSASQRYIVYARLQKAELANGDVWRLNAPAPVAAAA